MTVSVKEVKTFLRVDHNEDDTLIRSYIYAAESLCLDIMRTDDRTKLKSEKNAKVAILYAVASRKSTFFKRKIMMKDSDDIG